MRKPKFGHSVTRSLGHWPTFLFLFLMSQNLAAQSGPVTINGTFDKPQTKIALYELFYEGIDNNDIDPNEAEIDDQFLIVKNHNARLSQGRLLIDGDKVFTTDLNELPFLSTVNLLDNGQIWPSEVEYYYDNFENIVTENEANVMINSSNSTPGGSNCIQYTLFDVDGLFGPEFIEVFDNLSIYLSEVFCCSESSPINILIQPTFMVSNTLASASPLYFGFSVDSEGGCNGISENPVLQGLQGQGEQASVAIINVNMNINWHFGGGIQPNEYDLFSVMLHEALHALGAASRIGIDGNPLGGGYSPWDQFLEINGLPLLERILAPEGADCCYTYQINENLSIPDDIISASLNGQITIAGLSVCNNAQNVSTDGDFANMLSHIDENCTATMCEDLNTYSQFVLNSTLCPQEIKDELTAEELILMQTLGYCTNTDEDMVPSCYVSLIDDSFTVLETDETLYFNFSDFLENDILPTDFEVFDFNLLQDTNSPLSVTNKFGSNIVVVSDLVPGEYCFSYEIEVCEGFCDVGNVCIAILPETFNNPCNDNDCNLFCFGDFEIFIPNLGNTAGNNDYTVQLGLEDFLFENSTAGNSVDILSYEDNNFIKFVTGLGNIEGFYIPLRDPIPVGCTMTLTFNADCGSNSGVQNALFNILGFESQICDSPMSPEGLATEDLCGDSGNIFYNIGWDQSGNLIDCSGNNGSILDPDFEQSFTIEWTNNFVPINFLLFSVDPNLLNESIGYAIDNLTITSSCEAEIEVVAPESLVVCSGGSVSIDYTICVSGENDKSIDVILTENVINTLLGSISVNPLSPFDNGPVTTESLSTGECQNISLVVDLSPDLLQGQEVEVIMEFESNDACSLQDGQVSTIITIGDVAPSSGFNVLVECMNDPPTVSLTAFEPNNDQTTYAWDFGDGNTSSVLAPTHTYDQSGTYTVTLTVINECGTSTTSEVIDFNCDGNPSLDCPCATEGSIVLDDSNITTYSLQQLINDGTLPQDEFNGCLNLNGTLLVDVNYAFAGATMVMESGSAIEILSGITLTIGDASSLMGCDALWDGILVNDNAELEFQDSYIMDAFQAIHLQDGSSLSCQDNTFNKNYIGIFIPPNVNGVMNQIGFPTPIYGNTFECDDSLLPDAQGVYNLLFDDISYTGILLNDASMRIGVLRSGPVIQNEFRDLYNGVRAFNSSFVSSYSLFQRIVSNDEDSETGHGIYCINSFMNSAFSLYSETEFGIRGNSSNVRSNFDVFTLNKASIELIQVPNISFIVDANITEYSERGIDVGLTPNASFYIADNIIDNTNNSISIIDFPEAITVSSFGEEEALNPLRSIYHNTITLGRNQAGITLNNVDLATIEINNISIGENVSPAWNRGYQFNSSSFNVIKENSFNGSSLPSSGFSTEYSIENLMECNNSADSNIGFQFSGTCTKTNLLSNGMANASVAGLVINEGQSQIGSQEYNGNQWCGNSIAVTNANANFLDKSLFTVDPNGGLPNCVTLPFNIGSPSWFTSLPGDTPTCGDQGGRSDNQEFDGIDLKAARQTFEGDYQETYNWTIGRQLLQRIQRDPTLIGVDPEVDNFYASYQNSTMNSYNELDKNIGLVFEIRESLQNRLNRLDVQLRSLIEDISLVDIQIIQTQTDSEREQFLSQKSQLEKYYFNKIAVQRQLFNNIQANRIHSAAELIEYNSDLLTPNISALNEKMFNDIYLRCFVNSDLLFDPETKSVLSSIANQCVAEGGLSVYKFRALYDIAESGMFNNYIEVDNCQVVKERIAEDEDTNQPIDSEFYFYPNPSNGILIVESLKSEMGYIKVHDMLGKELYSFELNGDKDFIQLDLNGLKGLYLLSLYNAKGIIKTKKVILN